MPSSQDRSGPGGFENQLRQAAGGEGGGASARAGGGGAFGGDVEGMAAAQAAATVGVGAGMGVGQGQGQVEGFDGAWFDNLGFVDLGDMSWLSSVPSNL